MNLTQLILKIYEQHNVSGLHAGVFELDEFTCNKSKMHTAFAFSFK